MSFFGLSPYNTPASRKLYREYTSKRYIDPYSNFLHRFSFNQYGSPTAIHDSYGYWYPVSADALESAKIYVNRSDFSRYQELFSLFMDTFGGEGVPDINSPGFKKFISSPDANVKYDLTDFLSLFSIPDSEYMWLNGNFNRFGAPHHYYSVPLGKLRDSAKLLPRIVENYLNSLVKSGRYNNALELINVLESPLFYDVGSFYRPHIVSEIKNSVTELLDKDMIDKLLRDKIKKDTSREESERMAREAMARAKIINDPNVVPPEEIERRAYQESQEQDKRNYESPKQQTERLREAGINPAVYAAHYSPQSAGVGSSPSYESVETQRLAEENKQKELRLREMETQARIEEMHRSSDRGLFGSIIQGITGLVGTVATGFGIFNKIAEGKRRNLDLASRIQDRNSRLKIMNATNDIRRSILNQSVLRNMEMVRHNQKQEKSGLIRNIINGAKLFF